MEVFNSYLFIIAVSGIVIISYFFNVLSKKTNVPAVLMLITLGILLQIPAYYFDFNKATLKPVLEVLGIVGLIMIVLEAALDLELKREKWGIIWRSFSVALVGLILTSLGCAALFSYFGDMSKTAALIYAIPLAIISSAIVIPSVLGLDPEKKEFLIYESTFVDILGIMFFYLVLGNANQSSSKLVLLDVVTNIAGTVVISILVSYALVLVFQNLTTKVKLFLLIAVLLLLYSIGKLLHLSSLLIILVFGLVLHNHQLFFRGFMKKWLKKESVEDVLEDFRIVTMESAFVMRTFFFVIFGLSLVLGSLLGIRVLLYSAAVIGIIYGVRFIAIKVFAKKDLNLYLYVAPRGLVTVLLFFAIPEEYAAVEFESGIVLFTIIISSVLMAISLIKSKKDKEESIDDMIELEAVEKKNSDH
ncbi:MAG: cation:proton antiporter [Flavobacteriales bacterium]|nr:cation:proton antiporter [Flavobacteriales bacterium]